MAITKEELDEIISPKIKVERISTISTDGFYFVTRVPKEIVEVLKLEKGQKIRWIIEDEKLNIELLKNEK